jgi:hypothetical protein
MKKDTVSAVRRWQAAKIIESRFRGQAHRIAKGASGLWSLRAEKCSFSAGYQRLFLEILR